MRYNIFILTLCFGLSLAAQEVQLSWQKNFDIAKELSKSESKPILVYFSKTDCKKCMQFYTEFFKQKSFMDLENEFVLLMLDGSNNDIKSTDMEIIKQRRLVRHYNTQLTFPAVLALNSEGQTLGEMFSSTDADDMVVYFNFLETLK